MAVLGASAAFAGEFINLGFDQPNTTNLQVGADGDLDRGTASDLMPGWTVLRGGWNAPWEPYVGPVGFRYQGTQCYPITIGGGGGVPESGEYVVWFNFDPVEFQQDEVFFRLSQTGTVPSWATELRVYDLYGVSPLGRVRVAINGTPVSCFECAGVNKIDVRAYAGQEVELQFTTPDYPAPDMGYNSRFDILGFYPIPEPQTWALLVLGGCVLWWSRRRKPSRNAEG